MRDSAKNQAVKLEYQQKVVALFEEHQKYPDDERYRRGYADAYGGLSWHLLFVRNFNEAEVAARRALQIDSSRTWIRTNAAHALLLQGKYGDAEKEYLELRNIKDARGRSYEENLLKDFDDLKDAGIIHPDMDKVRELLQR